MKTRQRVAAIVMFVIGIYGLGWTAYQPDTWYRYPDACICILSILAGYGLFVDTML